MLADAVDECMPAKASPSAVMHVRHERETAAHAGIEQEIGGGVSRGLAVGGHERYVLCPLEYRRRTKEIKDNHGNRDLCKFGLDGMHVVKRIEDPIHGMSRKPAHEIGRHFLPVPHEPDVPLAFLFKHIVEYPGQLPPSGFPRHLQRYNYRFHFTLQVSGGTG